MVIDDTICAISTNLGESAINIIRLSGNDAIKIAASVFEGADLKNVESWTINHGFIINDSGERIDEVLVSVFKAPKSYTRENIVEINTHGGNYVTSRILSLIIAKGARLSEAGEFTKRAFLNGRIDLSEAEAVMDVISAKSKKALEIANKELGGKTRQFIESLRKELESLLLLITVNIDYPEYEDEVKITDNEIIKTASSLMEKIKKALEEAENMRVYREGIKTIILGKPNVGKSSLLNALIKEDKAIVTDISGTTRDIVEGEVNIGGIILHLIDTAGIRKTDDPIEKIGISKSIEKLNEAELVLLVLDHSQKISEEDKYLLQITKDKKRIIIGNKTDLNRNKIEGVETLDVSALTKEGLSLLEEKIKEMFINEEIGDSSGAFISSSRHISLLNQALLSLSSAKEAAINKEYVDMAMIDLRDAYDALGLITGKTASDTLIDELFAKFCLGK